MSGLYVLPKVPGGHQAVPVAESWRSERTGQAADMLDPGAYPLAAVCQACGGAIRLRVLAQMEWEHSGLARPGAPA